MIIVVAIASSSGGRTKVNTVAGQTGVASDSSDGAHPPQNDVTIGSCSVDSIGYPGATGTIINHSSGMSDYEVQVGFYNAAGVRLDTGIDFQNKVAPGAQVAWSAGGIARSLEGITITCKVISVDRHASL